MKISIVTISFNQSKFLRQCIDSVLSQEGVDLEYIVVDPASTDGSRDIIESYGDRIVKVFEPDAGPADGLNKGFSKAKGEVFGFINSDDFFLPGALQKISDHFDKEGLNSYVSGGGFIENKNGSLQTVTPSRMTLNSCLYGACTIFQQGTFFPASMFHQVGGFNTDNRTCWDGELFADFLAAGYNHKVIRDALAVFRLHEDSISGTGRLEKAYQDELKRIFKKIRGRGHMPLDSLLAVYWRARKVALRILGQATGGAGA